MLAAAFRQACLAECKGPKFSIDPKRADLTARPVVMDKAIVVDRTEATDADAEAERSVRTKVPRCCQHIPLITKS